MRRVGLLSHLSPPVPPALRGLVCPHRKRKKPCPSKKAKVCAPGLVPLSPGYAHTLPLQGSTAPQLAPDFCGQVKVAGLGLEATCTCRGAREDLLFCAYRLRAVRGGRWGPEGCLLRRAQQLLPSAPGLRAKWQQHALSRCWLGQLTCDLAPQKVKAHNPLRSFRHRGEKHRPTAAPS